MTEAWNPVPTTQPVILTDEYGACCSKTLNSITIPNVSAKSTSEMDDLAIAQIMQTEYDREFDEELKRLEQSRNKSKIAKFLMIHQLTDRFCRFKDFRLVGEVSDVLG